MERLWTPWRMSYISEAAGAAAEGCFLCAIGADSAGAQDAPNLVLFRGRHAFVLLNRYPYNSGHLLIAPYSHTADLEALSPDVGHELFDLTQRTVAALRAEYRPDGFNVGLNLGESAGAGLPGHLHVHAVPRWSGDTNFMPVLGSTKVLPEALEQTWARLRARFSPPDQPGPPAPPR